MSKWILPLLWGWFFTMQSPGELPETMVKTEISGFKTEDVCKAYRAETKDMLEAMGARGIAISKCEYRQEA